MNTINKDGILAIEEKLLNSIKDSNVANLDELLHDDLLFHTPNGQVITKAMDLDAHKTGNMIVHSIEASEHTISIFNDTAVVSLLIDTKGEAFGQPMEGKLRYIRTWKLFDGKLKVIGGSCIACE